jgi:hypothetical protein
LHAIEFQSRFGITFTDQQMTIDKIISWLLQGDPAIQYQANRDLLGINKPNLRKQIELEGWGQRLLAFRKADGYWGKDFYQPKWISTHYTLLDLKNLNLPPSIKAVRETLAKILNKEKDNGEGGIYPVGNIKRCDVCVNGMFLNYACYFGAKEIDLKSIVDFLLGEKMHDGGFNCHSNSKGAVHSSLHTTLSVLEGILEYERNGYSYRLNDLQIVRQRSQEFILQHKLFRSDKTGEIIKPQFTQLHYPCRWYYDILKALDYFQFAKVEYDRRMDDAIEILFKKRTTEGLWKLASAYPGKSYFQMEKAGKPSRWNTLRAMRVLKHFGKPEPETNCY